MEYESMEIIEVKLVLEIPKNFTGIVKYPNGRQDWLLKGKLHREDGPAVIYHNGEQVWFLNGLKHREDGPALIYHDGTQAWYLNGVLHREDGPAFIYSNSTQEWYLYGIRMTSMEVFEKLSDEQKEKVLWNLNQWK